MKEQKYYDGTKLLSLQDINGDRPEIYICTSNRSAGKTTYFNRYVLNRFIKYKEKFVLLYRYKYELDNCADKFFKEIGLLFFQGHTMSSKKEAMGIYHNLYFDEENCGYAIAMNSADQIKKNSHFFADSTRILFDEFQSETNNYCSNEIDKFQSIHVSIARGNGEQVKYLPVIMISNPITIINPYYVAMNISSRLQTNTKFLRGEGFVLEQGYVETASQAQKASGFNRAFINSSYLNYASEAVYLNDNYSFVETPKGNNRYICTLRYEGKDYAVRAYPDDGILYCDRRADVTFPNRIAVTTDDHRINYVMLMQNDLFISKLRTYFRLGCFRFHDLSCKECILKTISY